MKKWLSLVVFAYLLCICAQQTVSAFQGATGRLPAEPPAGGKPKSEGRKTPTKEPKRAPPTPPPAARFSIRSAPPGSQVFLDDEEQGKTDSTGSIHLRSPVAGWHKLKLRKSGYHNFELKLSLSPGLNGAVDVKMIPYPGRLNITTIFSDAIIHIHNIGTYTGGVSGLELQPGMYHLSVEKLGYFTSAQNIEISPGGSSDIFVPLKRLPASELLARAEASFQSEQFDQTLTLASMILEENPTHARANVLLGLVYYRRNDHARAILYFRQAILLGESLTINVKHLHKLKRGEGLCQGQLIFSRDFLEFRSAEYQADNFRAPYRQLLELRLEQDKGSRLHLKLSTMPSGKKKKPTLVSYSFHSQQAQLQNKDPRKPTSPAFVVCSGCQPVAQFLYQLTQRLSQ